MVSGLQEQSGNLLLAQETPLLLGLPVSSPSRPDLVMHRVDWLQIWCRYVVSWFIGQQGGYAGRFPISGEQTLMPIPKNQNKPKNPLI